MCSYIINKHHLPPEKCIFVCVGFRQAVSFRECVHRFEIPRYQRRLFFQVFIPSFIPYLFIVSDRADARSGIHSRHVLDRVRGC